MNEERHAYTAYATVLVWVESDTELTDSEVENKAKDAFAHATSNGGFRRDEIAIEWETYL
jgi:hypothetical protein